MVATPVAELRHRAEAVATAVSVAHPSATACAMEALPGAGSAPGVTMASYGIEIHGDLLATLRRHDPPVIARSRNERTMLDLRSVAPVDDAVIVAALTAPRAPS